MKSKQLTWLTFIVLIITTVTIISACNKKFDEPEIDFPDPNIPVTMTLRELKALLPATGQVREVTDDKVISGIIVADDRSGNFYQSISIQDATGGVSVRIAGGNNFTSYPIGRRIYIKVKGLCIGEYGGMIQLGSKSTTGTTLTQVPIPTNLFDTYIIKGSFNNVVTPRVFTSVSQLVTSLQDSVQNTLIQLDNFQFNETDTARTFADPTLAASAVNITLQGCNGNSIILRTSSYANFAGLKVPRGGGSIRAIYTFFNGTRQLLIRDTSDISFNGTRCGQGPTTVMNISDVRALFTGTTTSAPTGRRITGVVISDRANANTQTSNLIIQQGNNLSGIVVRFTGAHSYDLGDSLDINVSGMEVSEFSGTLQVNNVPLSYATRVATGRSITPRVVTNTQLNANFEAWESTLVQINNVTLSGGSGGNWGANGSVTINDGTGSVVAFTRTGASFQNTAYPTGTVSFVRGYTGQFNTTNQISLRSTSDVGTTTGGGGGGGSSTTIDLTTSPLTFNFNNIESAGLPTGVFVYNSATATAVGTQASLAQAKALWSATGLGFKNFASATGLTSTADQAAQDASTNRAIGVRQTGTAGTGGDPGAAFTFVLTNTTGKNNVQLQFLLQSLDASSSVTRVTTWTVDYGIGDNPTSFTPITTTPGTLTTNNTFASTTVNVTLPTVLNNNANKIWIRIVTLSNTTGSGSRPSTGIDDVRFTWN